MENPLQSFDNSQSMCHLLIYPSIFGTYMMLNPQTYIPDIPSELGFIKLSQVLHLGTQNGVFHSAGYHRIRTYSNDQCVFVRIMVKNCQYNVNNLQCRGFGIGANDTHIFRLGLPLCQSLLNLNLHNKTPILLQDLKHRTTDLPLITVAALW